ncbi:multicopper oxidase family protein [Fulvimarina manganoxydans]|uniref:multicopper oxidase family protein n=1 Tax=Fulvimarina manganoxydans TaxID=937218 RepID=UPI002355FACC|nr:multicopper oxidase family protein [Fulvimarina manganoxydans]
MAGAGAVISQKAFGRVIDLSKENETALVLTARRASASILPSDLASPTAIWGFDGTAPGPVLRAKAGERLKVVVENGLDQPTSVHWHGIRIDNAMDGVPGLTQEAIEPGGRFFYDFRTPDPGTYWYHSHDRSWEQNARGLHGALIVEEAERWKGADRDIVLLVDDWRLTKTGAIEDSFGQMMDWSHGGRLGNVVTVNGRYKPRIAFRPNERVRLRLINAANARIMDIGFRGAATRLLALDGMATSLAEMPGPVRLAPAQRADLLVDFPASPKPLAMTIETRDGPVAIAEISVSGEPVRAEFPEPIGLPAAGLPVSSDLQDARRAELRMEGGAMGRMTGAMHDGRMMDIRSLAQTGRVWAFNGVAGDMNEPLARFERGRTAVVKIRNETPWPHAMHVHGHHFRVVSRDGGAILDPVLRDTDLMMPDETIEIAFVADNPGKWLLHCHMLEHSASGMMTWFEVA